MNRHTTLALLSLIATACTSDKPILAIDSLDKTPQELRVLEDKAQAGDSASALSLAYFYLFVVVDNELAESWFKRAAELGGQKEKKIYESFMDRENG